MRFDVGTCGGRGVGDEGFDDGDAAGWRGGVEAGSPRGVVGAIEGDGGVGIATPRREECQSVVVLQSKEWENQEILGHTKSGS